MSQFMSWYATGKRFALAHKVVSGIVLLALLGGGYFLYTKATATPAQTHYMMGTVATGTIVASISESGQIATANTVSTQPQVSGQITWVGVRPGDKVRAGQALVSIDDTTAQQTLAAAKRQLAADQLTYQQSAAQAPINYQNDRTALQTAKTNLQDDYNTTFNDLTAAYLDLPAVMTTANNTIYGYDLDTKKSQWNMDVLTSLFQSGQMDTSKLTSFRSSSVSDYSTANTAYSSALSTYQITTRSSSTDAIDTLLTQSIAMTTDAAQALQSELNFLGAVSDLAQTYNTHLPSAFSTLQSTARATLSTINGDLTTLLNDKKTLDNAKQAIVNAQNTVTLDQVGNPNGDNPISLQVSANSIAKEQQDIANQEQNLSYYTIRAPFDGTVSAVSAQVGNNASGNLVSMVSTSLIADLSVNEVDAAKIALGQKATITFDAVPGLSLTGSVAQINSVGTVSQGVVSYDIQIRFDATDPRVKPGMTLNANIQTGVAHDTLIVPSSAVKTSGSGSYVLAFNPPIAQSAITAAGTQGIVASVTPVQIPVTTGLSDTANTQILSGLSGGEQIVVRTVSGTATPTAAANATTRTGAGGFGGGGIRIGG
jgi:HlyD family secretion protein